MANPPDEILLFTDASFAPELSWGVGAMLVLPGPVKTVEMKSESIARLELETALWAIAELKQVSGKCPPRIRLITDSQTIENLPSRRHKIHAGLRNADLYRCFYQLHDELSFTITRVKGHSPLTERTQLQQTFAIVDRAARLKLRQRMRTEVIFP